MRAAEKAQVAFEVNGLGDLRGRLAAAGYATTDDESLAGYQRCYVAEPFEFAQI